MFLTADKHIILSSKLFNAVKRAMGVSRGGQGGAFAPPWKIQIICQKESKSPDVVSGIHPFTLALTV
jgi:hypothetical protein